MSNRDFGLTGVRLNGKSLDSASSSPRWPTLPALMHIGRALIEARTRTIYHLLSQRGSVTS